MKEHLQDLLRNALASLSAQELAGVELPATPPLERTRDSTHGDWATNVALMLAKPASMKPREVAELIVAKLPASPQVSRVEIAGPGFINFFLTQGAAQAVIAEILSRADSFGHGRAGAGQRVLIEFVSANPTGPMHVGHGRNAAVGDSVARLLAAAGYEVHREYYINDAGRQADVLAVSVWLRYLDLCGVKAAAFPKRGYPAAYIGEVAAALRATHGDRFSVSTPAKPHLPPDPQIPEEATEAHQESLKEQQERYLDALIALAREALGQPRYLELRRFALDSQLEQIRKTLGEFGVHFDHWASEDALVASGAVQHALERLKAASLVYQKDGALWMKTEAFGDEKDRVLYKADGAATYFANDLAYHVNKLERGWPLLIDVWGADHHGYVGRVRAAIEALTGRKDALEVELIQFVTLSSGRMGKRSGNFVTLNDLLREVGADATRFFYLLRSSEQHFEFDLDLARSQSMDNPVYYIQYAHARVCSVEKQMQEKGFGLDHARGLNALGRLTESHEQAVVTQLSRFPEIVAHAAQQRAPQAVAHYLRDLADAFHSYYNAHTFLVEDADLRSARLCLVLAVRQVIRNGLALLGVSAPATMYREAP